MSRNSEGKDAKGRDDHQSTQDDTSNADSMGIDGTSDIGAVEGRVAGKGTEQAGQQASQQSAMPPSQTDDDQYDQGTVQREP